MKFPQVSIITVNYNVEKALILCLKSIYNSKTKLSFEVIVVDNSNSFELKKNIKKYFPSVNYIKSFKNLGFGAGNNLGARHANGEYLFFLNPDTEIFRGTIDILYDYFYQNKKTGIVSPLILDKNLKPFIKQGYKELTPLRAIFSFSPLRKLFFSRTIYQKYSQEDWKEKPIRQVDTVTGAAFMTSSKIFKKINGFDERFFLYFEENDISKIIKDLGYRLYVNSNSRVIHKVGQSTKGLKDANKIFSKSRFLYFKKHYGFLKAVLIDNLIKINFTSTSVFMAIVVGLFLRFYNLSNNMQFIGDQGWFYLSARDLLISGKIPLVGITSSHLWLHQGPLWTYMLSFMLFVFNFNPLSGTYLTAILGVATVFLIYKIGNELFSKNVGIFAAFLYAASPLVVFYDRIPFDPSPIPLFTVLLFYSLVKWLKGNINYFPLILFFIAILYNLELATFTLFFPFVFILVYGFYKKRIWAKSVLDKKIITYSILLGLIPMLPVIFYDFSNGFKQTIVFFAWTLYKPFSFLVNPVHVNFIHNQLTLFNFLVNNVQQIVFPFNSLIAFMIFISAFLFLTYTFVKKQNRTLLNPKLLLLLFLIVSVGGIIINQVPSGAYLPVSFPFIIFTLAVFAEFIFSIKTLKFLAFFLFLIILLLNIKLSILNSSTNDFKSRLEAVNKIISLTKGEKYNLIGIGPGSQFASFTMNYEYLLWWKGYAPSKHEEKTKITISEGNSGIIVEKK